MKKYVFLICLLLPAAVFGDTPAAGKAQSLTCFQRRPYLEMSMKWDEAGGFTLGLLAPDGAEGLPLFYGTVTSYTLGYLRQQKEDLSNWPSKVSLYWAPGKCRKDALDPWLVECGGPAEAGPVAPAWPYSTSTFISYRQRQSGVALDFDSRRMTWAVETQGNVYFLGFSFMADHCQ